MKLSPQIFSKTRALVLGDVMLDRYWFGQVERISPEAPVPVLSVSKVESRAGGAANVAHNILSLGAQAKLLSVIGDDGEGQEIKNIIESYGATTSLKIDASVNTIVKLRMMSQNQQLLRADFDQPPSEEILAQCLQDYQEALATTDVVVLSDYGKGGLRHVSKMVELAQQAKVPVVIDPKGDDYSRYRGATLLTPNTKEFETVVGECASEKEFERKAFDLLESLELKYLLVTRSEKGMSLFAADGQHIHSPARALEVYDVSGAGDTVISIVALTLASDLTDEQKLELANTAAGIVVGKLGTAVTDMDEVISRLKAS